MYQIAQRFQALLNPTLLLTTGMSVVTLSTTLSVAQLPPPPSTAEGASPAQAGYPTCQPPDRGEYLLLVMSKTPESQDQVRRVVPSNAKSTVCSYLDDVVTRVSGFTTLDTANAWARYLTESGLSAFVARPSEVASNPLPSTFPQPTPTVTPQPTAPVQATATAARTTTFNPQPLGSGYAVLVDFFSQPELAAQVQQQLGKGVGLVSYRQRPYLLAIYTTDQNAANSTLQALTERGFWAMLVDSRRVTVLRQVIDLQRSVVSN